MAFKLVQPKQISQWVDFESGDIKAKIKIRGSKYKPFVTATERIQNVGRVEGFKIEGVGSNEMSFQDMLFKVTAEYLIEDWQNIAIEKDGEIVDVPYDKDIAFELMSFGGAAGLILWDFITSNANKIQAEADEYKEEILGKYENSTDGQKSEVAKKPRSKTK